jgi:hypothetical protein
MLRYQLPVTPSETAGNIARLCAELVPGQTPVYVDVQADLEGPVKECFPLVTARVDLDGGNSVLGWALWELPGVFVEAEFHAVWRDPTGKFADITPRNRPISRILFLPDASTVYEGRQIENVRHPINQAPEIAQYLDTFRDEFSILNRGSRANQYGEIVLSGQEAEEMNAIYEKRASLHYKVLALSSSVGPYTPCLCSSGKKVKWCHGIHNVA